MARCKRLPPAPGPAGAHHQIRNGAEPGQVEPTISSDGKDEPNKALSPCNFNTFINLKLGFSTGQKLGNMKQTTP